MTSVVLKLWTEDIGQGQDIARICCDAGGHSGTRGWHNPTDWNEHEQCLFRNRQFNWPIKFELQPIAAGLDLMFLPPLASRHGSKSGRMMRTYRVVVDGQRSRERDRNEGTVRTAKKRKAQND